MKDVIQKQLKSSAENMLQLAKLESVHLEIQRATEVILDSLVSGGTLFVCGNGGSAGDAQNLVTELVARLKDNRTPIRALCLNADTSVLTAISNDFSYEHVFARQLEALAKPKDVLMVITTSGNSPNVLKALEQARKQSVKTVLLGGYQGGKAKALANVSVIAPGENAGFIQECHIAIYHLICGLLEAELAQKGLVKFDSVQK
jgi:D-sedoheptulose 7-phosphate isomerase